MEISWSVSEPATEKSVEGGAYRFRARARREVSHPRSPAADNAFPLAPGQPEPGRTSSPSCIRRNLFATFSRQSFILFEIENSSARLKELPGSANQ